MKEMFIIAALSAPALSFNSPMATETRFNQANAGFYSIVLPDTRKLMDGLRRTAIRRIGNPDEADDIVQESLLAALSSTTAKDIVKYSYGVLRHLIAQKYTERKRRTNELTDTHKSKEPNALDVLLSNANVGLIREATNALKTKHPSYHESLARTIANESADNASESMGISKAHFLLKLRRARKFIRHYLSLRGLGFSDKIHVPKHRVPPVDEADIAMLSFLRSMSPTGYVGYSTFDELSKSVFNTPPGGFLLIAGSYGRVLEYFRGRDFERLPFMWRDKHIYRRQIGRSA